MKKHSLIFILSFFFHHLVFCSDFQFSLDAGELKVLTARKIKSQIVKNFRAVDYNLNNLTLLGWDKLFSLNDGEVYDLILQDNYGQIIVFQYVRRTATLINNKQHNRITRGELEQHYNFFQSSCVQKFRCGNNCYTAKGDKLCHSKEYHFNGDANITLCAICYNKLYMNAN